MKILFVNAPYMRVGHQFQPDCLACRVSAFNYHHRKQLPRFVNSLIKKATRGVRYGVRAGSRWPWTMNRPIAGAPYPFIMAYAAAYLETQGYKVDIWDAIAEQQYSYRDFLTTVRQHKADIVVVECATPTIDIDLWIAQHIAEFTDVALAGPHLVDGETEKLQENYPQIKYFLKGEYIRSSLTMAQSCRPGIYQTDVVKDLDSFPFPFRTFVSATKYYEPTMPTARPQLQIYASKGCPYKCSFCLWPHTMYQGKVALRSPEKVAEEIRLCRDRYGYRSILFDDDTFNLGTERISKLCDYLQQIGLPWTMMGRLDASPDWLYDKMVDCGCVGMRFGVETFNVDVLKRISKGLERVDFRKTLEHISFKYPELMIHLTMMKDLPSQTEAIHQEDMRILAEMGYDLKSKLRNYQLAACAPFPGTKLYEELQQTQGHAILEDYARYDGAQDTVMKKVNQG